MIKQVNIEQAMQLAVELQRAGRLAEAERIYQQILSAKPDYAPALNLLGIIAGQTGRTDLAIGLLRRAIQISPKFVEAFNNLGNVMRAAGNLEEAIAAFLTAIGIKPDYAEAHNNLGVALRNAGRLEEAAESLLRAIGFKPDFFDAYYNLGLTRLEQSRPRDAAEVLRKALAINPNHAGAWSHLGDALAQIADTAGAVDAYRRAIAILPQQPTLHYNLANALRDERKLEDSETEYRNAIALSPDFAAAHHNLANLLKNRGDLDTAVTEYHRVLELEPNYADAYANLAAAQSRQGRVDLSLQTLRKALEIRPENARIHSNLILDMHFSDQVGPERILQEARRWSEVHELPLAPKIMPITNDREPERRLRIGYVSSDFRAHPVANFVQPLFRHHDPKHFDVYGYSGVNQADDVTTKIKSLVHHWRDIAGVSDELVAAQIRDDRIDILVDLSLHSAGNRLLVFARKPAPIAVTWLGYTGTTGLRAIDYRFTDPHLDPPGENDELYSEKSVRLPSTFYCYEPPVADRGESVLPAQTNGHITFGCLNNFAKVTPKALDLWTKVLAAAPGARMLISSDCGSHRDAVLQRYQSGGVESQRVEFVDRVGLEDYFRLYERVDICLDPMPFTGHTTTIDGLWMGVPPITLAGKSAVERGSVSALMNLNLGDWIAPTQEQYVALAVEKAANVSALSKLRGELRHRMKFSPLMDGVAFAAGVERAFRRMWQNWIGETR